MSRTLRTVFMAALIYRAVSASYSGNAAAQTSKHANARALRAAARRKRGAS